MTRTMFFGSLAALIVISVSIGVALAITDSQSTSGTITATSSGVDLYVCEASDAVQGPTCASDDSGADEIIFEGPDDLHPGETIQWDLRLKNIGVQLWQVTTAQPVITIASDPGGDCGVLLEGEPTLGHLAILDNQLITNIAVGNDPEGLAVNSSTNKAYIANQQDDTVTVIDTQTRAILSTVAVGNKPKSVAVNPAIDRVYVGNVSGSLESLMIIDGTSDTVINTILLNGGQAENIAVNATTNRVFVAISGGSTSSVDLYVIDGLTGAIVGTVDDVRYWGVAVNTVTNLVYVSSVSGSSVVIIDAGSNSIVGSVSLSISNLRGVAVDETTDRVFVVSQSGEVAVLDGVTAQEIDTDGNPGNGTTPITVGSNPLHIEIDQEAGLLYVSNFADGSISIIDTTDYSVVSTISPGSSTRGIGIDTSLRLLINVNQGSDSVTIQSVGGVNDDRDPGVGQDSFPVIGASGLRAIHVEPGDFEDVRLFVRLPADAPPGCADTAWDVSIPWQVDHVAQ